MDSSAWFWLLFTLWTIGVIYIGYKGYTLSPNFDEFSVPRTTARIGPYQLGMSIAATQASVATFMGVAGFVYLGGLSGLWWLMMVPLVHAFGIVIAGKYFREIGLKLGSLQVPDWMGHRFGSDVVRGLASLIYFFNLFFVISILAGFGHIFHIIMGMDYQTGIIIAAIIAALYSFFGGNYAVIKTDVLQTVIMCLLAVIIASLGFVFFNSIGEINLGLFQQNPALLKPFNPGFMIFAGPLAIFGFSFYQFVMLLSPHMANKFLMLQEAKDFKKMIFTAGITVFILSLSVFGGLYARVLLPGLQYPDRATLELITTYFPGILAAILGLGLISAGTSTLDSILVSMGTVAGNDVFRRIIAKRTNMPAEKTERTSFLIGRIVIIFACAFGAFYAMKPPALLAILSAFGVFGFLAGCVGPMLWGMYWKGANKYGAIAAMIVGPAVHMYLFFGKIIPNSFICGTYATITGAVVMLIVSLATQGIEKNTMQDAVAKG
ncbi:MAG: sodium:solute symporter family protein [Bacillota bacterium]